MPSLPEGSNIHGPCWSGGLSQNKRHASLHRSSYPGVCLGSFLMPNCGDCGGGTTWNEDVCSIICNSCGTLQDPTQSVLASHLEEHQHNNSARQSNNPLWQASTTLKSVRGSGWYLAGQGKEARDKKNMVREMKEYASSQLTILPTMAVRNARFHQVYLLKTFQSWHIAACGHYL